MDLKVFISTRKRSFAVAIQGVFYTIRSQKNTWVHSTITLIVILLGLWLKISIQNWAILVISMGIVWVAEFINTAIETVVDLVSPEFNIYAKISKDVSAAAVLISAITSACVGLLILGPPLWQSLFNH